MKAPTTLLIVLALLCGLITTAIDRETASAQAAPSIKLTPTNGICAVTIEGTGFSTWSGITIFWDGTAIPAVTSTAGNESAFTAIISVPEQMSPGFHTILLLSNGRLFG